MAERVYYNDEAPDLSPRSATGMLGDFLPRAVYA